MKISIVLSCLLFLCLISTSVIAKEKSFIGETAWIEVGTASFSILARIDTGAHATSIHAVNVEVKDGSSVPDENIGKDVSFQTVNQDGKTQQMTSIITKVSTVINSQGTEQRYVIELPLAWKHVKKKVQVNLRDRSKMTYKLLIGRNFLSGDFLVDVDKKADKKEESTNAN